MKSLKSCRVNVMVSNMDRAIEFYSGKLGLTLMNRYGDHYAEIQTPDMSVALHPMGKEIKKGNNMSIGFGVTAFDDTVTELQSKGIVLTIEKDGWIRLAHFADEDGNALFLAERKE